MIVCCWISGVNKAAAAASAHAISAVVVENHLLAAGKVE